MKRLVQYFLDNTFLVNLISAFVIIVGIYSAIHVKKGLIPPWSQNRIQIKTFLNGSTPKQIEKYITLPIEQTIKDLNGIEYIKSSSLSSFSNIYVGVKYGFNDYDLLQKEIEDRIDQIRHLLPREIEQIDVKILRSSTKWFGSYAILNFDENNDHHQRWLTKTKNDLMNINGIANVTSSNRTKNFYLNYSAEKLARYQVNIGDITNKIIETLNFLPLGVISKGEKQYFVEVKNTELDVKQIENLTVRANSSDKNLTLKDVANVEYRLPEKYSYLYTNEKPSVEITLHSSNTADMIKLNEVVTEKIKHIKKDLPTGIQILTIGDGPTFLERQIKALKSNSLLGILLVIAVLFLFLGWKNSIMTAIGLPFCYGFTFIALNMMGISLDLISIVGMLLVIGIIVDDAIIIAEEYSSNLQKGLAPKEAATAAVGKMWIPVLGAALTTIVAFLPLLLNQNPGVSSLKPIGIVVVVALFISLFECYFILPNHLAHFVKKPKESKSNILFKLKYYYSKTLNFTLKLRYLFTIFFIGALVYTIQMAQKHIPMNFNLNISNEQINIEVVLNESKNLEHSKDQLLGIFNELGKIDQTKYKYNLLTIGNSYINGELKKGAEIASVSYIFDQNDPNLKANITYVRTILKERIKSLKNDKRFKLIQVKTVKQGKEKSKENQIEVIASSSQPFSYYELSNDIKNNVKNLKGITSVNTDTSKLVETWQFSPNYPQVMKHGLSLRALAAQLRHYISPTKIYESRASDDQIQIYGQIEKGRDQNYQSIQNKPMVLNNGTSVKINELGSWEKTYQYYSIEHYNLKRRVSIFIPFDKEIVKKENLIKDIKKSINTTTSTYPNIELKVRDADEASRKNKKSMSTTLIYTLTSIFLILSILLKSIVKPVIIIMAIPFGVIGVLWALYFQSLTLSLMGIIGLIGMAGVVVNDSLILVTTIDSLKTKARNFAEQLIEGASSRLRAIILTSLTTLGGLFPMAYAIGGDAGFTKALAMTMGWGILFATILTLYLIPCFLNIQHDFSRLGNYLMAKISKKPKIKIAKKTEAPPPMSKIEQEIEQDHPTSH